MRLRHFVSLHILAGFSALVPVVSGAEEATTVLEAADRARPIAVPAQPIETALNELARQSGIHVVIDSRIAGDVVSTEVKGKLKTEEALTRLLKSTGLTYRVLDAQTISVEREAERTTSREEVAGSELRLAQAGGSSAVYGSEAAGQSGEVNRDTTGSARNSDGAWFEEIVVTAQKRVERLIDVPQSMSVLSADYLNRINAVQFRDFANTVPGLTFTTQGAGLNQISLRGVTAGADLSPTVGIYVDEVPYGSSTTYAAGALLGLDVAPFDLDRIEVLRGPQGTLYGASSMGGLIKYVTRQPDTRGFSGDVRAGVSGTERGGTSYNVAGAVNVPISSGRAALRASAFQSHDGGYLDNLALGETDVNGSDVYGGRADLLFAPNDALTLRITGFLQNIDRGGDGRADYTLSGVPRDGSLTQRHLRAESFYQRFRLGSGTLTYDLGRASFISISSYQTVESSSYLDVSPLFAFLALPSFGSRQYSAVTNDTDLATDRFVQEVRFASKGGGTLEWLIGGFYTREDSQNDSVIRPFNLAGQPAPTDISNIARPSLYEEYAGFGDLTWRLTDKFDVTGGVRYARNDLKTERVASGLLVGPQTPTRSTDDVFTYLANTRYRFSDHATAYLRYATGYRPGGPNFTTRDAITGLPIGPETFESDRLKSYEVGFKAESDDRRFGVDVAGYYIDWTNIQVTLVRAGFSGIGNAAGGASIRGGELTLTARPVSGFTASGAFAYQDAKLSEADPDLRGTRGERLPNVPRFTAALNADYTLPMGSLQPTVGATLRYVSDRTSGFSGTPTTYYRFPEYTTVDLRTGFIAGPVNVQLYVRNLADERGQLSTSVLGTTARVSILQPRTIGVSVNASF